MLDWFEKYGYICRYDPALKEVSYRTPVLHRIAGLVSLPPRTTKLFARSSKHIFIPPTSPPVLQVAYICMTYERRARGYPKHCYLLFFFILLDIIPCAGLSSVETPTLLACRPYYIAAYISSYPCSSHIPTSIQKLFSINFPLVPLLTIYKHRPFSLFLLRSLHVVLTGTNLELVHTPT